MAETPPPVKSRFDLLGSPVDPLTMDESLREIDRMLDGPGVHQHAVVNAWKILLARKDPELRKILWDCRLVNADGQAVVWAARFLGHDVPERVAGIDLMQKLFERAQKTRRRVFLFGATEDVIRRTAAVLREQYSGLVIAGFRSGYFREDEEPAIAQQIRSSGAELLFVGMSSPKKELWLKRNLERTGVKFAMGVGGSFDVLAGKTRRAPRWMMRLGLEWFYRWMHEPVRLARRYIVGNIAFLLLVLRKKLFPGKPVSEGRVWLREALESMELMPRYNRRVYEFIKPYFSHPAAEIGCGLGTMTEFILESGDVTGVDIDPDFVAHARGRFSGRKNFSALHCDISKGTGGLRPGSFASAVCLNTLEHIEDDAGALDNINRILAPGGRLVALVPAFRFLYGSLDRAAGHRRRYAAGELRLKMEQAGFIVIREIYLSPLSAAGWFAAGRVLRLSSLPRWLLKFHDSMVPFLRRIETRWSFGLSLVCVAQKR